MRNASEVLSESEVSHRLVDRAIGELRASPADTRLSRVDEQDVRDCMRDELFGLLAHLHFADFSARELDLAADRIAEMRRWMDCLESEGVDLPR